MGDYGSILASKHSVCWMYFVDEEICMIWYNVFSCVCMMSSFVKHLYNYIFLDYHLDTSYVCLGDICSSLDVALLKTSIGLYSCINDDSSRVKHVYALHIIMFILFACIVNMYACYWLCLIDNNRYLMFSYLHLYVCILI